MIRPCMRLPSGLGWSDRRSLATPSLKTGLRTKLAGLVIGAALLAACEPSPGANPAIRLSLSPAPVRLAAAPNVPGDPDNGRKLFTDTKFYPPNGCGSCHTLLGYSTGAYPGAPNLTNMSLRPTLAGETLQNNPAQMKAWILDPPAQKRDAKMPKLNVSDQEATDLTAFLYSLPYNAAQ
jgi:mono/diheme cytochrome c family protein